MRASPPVARGDLVSENRNCQETEERRLMTKNLKLDAATSRRTVRLLANHMDSNRKNIRIAQSIIIRIKEILRSEDLEI
jgi:hypothetical protein